jgi:hypothetical protein
MFDSHAAPLGGVRHRSSVRSGGVPGNIFIGLLLIPPVAVKLGGTGYRFARYYGHDEPYVRKGPPPAFLRLLAPGVVGFLGLSAAGSWL